jgi:hypothetical protein
LAKTGRSTSKTFYAETFATTVRAICGLSLETPWLRMTKSAGSKTLLFMKKHRPIHLGSLRLELVDWNHVISDPRGLSAKTVENLEVRFGQEKKDTVLKRADIIAYTIISLHTL